MRNAAAALLLAVLACHPTPPPLVHPVAHVVSSDEGWRLVISAAPALPVGTRHQYGAMLVQGPHSLSCGPVTWTSSTPGIATIDASGVLRAQRPGTTEITAQCHGVATTVTARVTR